MVNSINSNVSPGWKGSSGIPDSKYVINGLKSESAVKAVEETDSFSLGTGITAVGSTALFEGIPYALYQRNNKKLNGKMTYEMERLSKSTQEAWKNLRSGSGSFIERLGKYFHVVNKNFAAYSDVRSIASAKANLNEKEKNAIEKAAKAKESPNWFRNWRANRAEKSFTNAQTTAAKTITPASITDSGITAGKTIKTMLKTSGVGIMLALGGIIEGVLEVYPTFKELGNEKGMKQLGKSTVKVLSDTAAFVAGQQAGMAVGSAIGTALFPGVGTVIGGVTGMITGCLCTCASDKITEKILGKSERELAKEQQEQTKSKNVFSVTV